MTLILSYSFRLNRLINIVTFNLNFVPDLTPFFFPVYYFFNPCFVIEVVLSWQNVLLGHSDDLRHF